jgi:hypothetical protein
MSAETLTRDDIDMIYDAADMAGMTIRDFPRWPSAGYTVGLVGDVGEFQKFLRSLGLAEADTVDDREELLADRLGDWKVEGVGLSTVWYWPQAELDEDSHERVREIEEDQESYR